MEITEQRGVAAIEFAIVLPLLVLLLFGIIEFSVLLYDKAVITNASREGARAGIVFVDQNPCGPSDAEIINVIQSYCSNYLITFGAATTPTTTIARSGCTVGDSLTVTVRYQYNFLIIPNLTFYGAGFPGGINVQAQTVMRLER